MAFIIILMLPPIDAENPMVSRMVALTAWVAIWWLTEAIHLAITALLPFILLPVMGIADSKLIAAQYMDQTIFLFIGGFLLAFAIERWNLHRRIALNILSKLGKNPSTILAGVMITTFLLSNWVSNTATTMMLIAAVLALITQTENDAISEKEKNAIAKALLLGLAYAASIGGMGTLVGTPPNMIFYKAYNDAFPQSREMDFFHWFMIGFPTACLLLVAAFFILKILFLRNSNHIRFDKTVFTTSLRALGKMSYEEKVVSVVFATAAVLWFTRSDIDFGSFRFSGWERIFGAYSNYVTDSTVAVGMAFILFLIPSVNEKGKALLSWDEARKLPLGIILLFGGGFALAKGFDESGLSTWLAERLLFLKDLPPVLLIAGICVMVCVISEFASNVASIQLALPILVSIHLATGIHPLMLMVPATLAASLGFMLPVATAPNTIVFGSGRIAASDMRNAGSILDIAGIIAITLVSILIGSMFWK
jgi:sodium-dependent dicarboxylate transporter 2/3/5